MFCPNINNKEVVQQFNEIVESLGGSPLTVDEFKDSSLRNKRENTEYAAMESAYKIWNSNLGNPIDMSPNGLPSRLFSDVLRLCNGNRLLTVRIKSKVYSEAFKSRFGDWLNNDKSNISNQLDENEEPLIGSLDLEEHNDLEKYLKNNYSKESINRFDEIKDIKTTDQLIKYISKLPNINEHTLNLLNRLSEHYTKLLIITAESIPGLVAMEYGKIASYNGNLKLYEYRISSVSNLGFAEDVAHELLHHYLQKYYDENKAFRSKILKIKLLVKRSYLYELYGLDKSESGEEFLNEFMSNSKFRNKLKITGSNIFETMIRVIKSAIKYLVFNKTTDYKMTDKLSDLEQYVYNLIDAVNDGRISTYNKDSYVWVDSPKKELSNVLRDYEDNQLESFEDSLKSEAKITAKLISVYTTTKELLDFLKEQGNLEDYSNELLDVLSKYNVPIEIINNDSDDYVYYLDGKIYINENLFNKHNDKFNSKSILHDLVHAYTVLILSNPLTDEEKSIVSEIKDTYDKFVEQSKKNGTNEEYGFKSDNEFVAEFMTNKLFRQLLYNTSLASNFLDKLKQLIRYILDIFVKRSGVEDRLSENKLRLDIYKLMNMSIPSVVYTDARFNANSGEEDWQSYLDTVKEDEVKLNLLYLDTINKLNDKKTEEEYNKAMKFLLTEIYNGVVNRMRSIDLRSNIEKTKVTGLLKYIQSMLRQMNVSDSEKMMEFINDLMENNVSALYNIHDAVAGNSNYSSKAILQFKLDYVGFYYAILRDIKDRLLNNPNFKEIFGENYDNFKAIVDSLYEKFDQANLDIDQLIYGKVKEILLNYGINAGSNTIKDFVETNLRSTNYDMSNALIRLTAMGDKVNDESVRIVFDMINTADKITYTSTYYRGKKIISAAKKFKKNGGNLLDLFEKDENNTKTGYLIRPVKQGLLERKIKTFETLLRVKYGVEDGYTPSSLPTETRTAYYKELNDFTSKIAIRRYTDEYYSLFNNLSEAARNKREVNQYRIANFKKQHSREDGTFHIEDLTDREYTLLLEINYEKKQTANLFYPNGKPKLVGTIDHDIALELSQLNNALNDGVSYTLKNEGFEEMTRYYDLLLKDKKITASLHYDYTTIDLDSEHKHILEAKKAFSHEIDQYGTSEYQRWYQTMVDSLKFKKIIDYKKETLSNDAYKKWYKRSMRITTDQLFFKQIDNIDNEAVYKNDYLEYNNLREQLRELQKQFRDDQYGVPNTTLMNNECRKLIKLIYSRMLELSKKHRKKGEVNPINLIAKFVKSPYFFLEKKMAAMLGEVALEVFLNRETSINPFTGEEYVSPYFRQMVPKDPSLVRIVPNGSFYELSSNSKYVNPNWKEGGPYYQPNGREFNNQKEFDRVMSINGGKELYDLLVNTMETSNKLIDGHSKDDSYYMPMLSGSIVQYLKNAVGKSSGNAATNIAKSLINYAKDSFISVRSDDLGYRENFDEDKQLRPDGSKLNFVPINFVGEKGLEDMGELSNDIIYMYTAYFNMANNYANKQKIQPDVELILALLGNRPYKNDKKMNGGISTENKSFTTSGKETQLYLFASKLMEMQLYGEKVQPIYYNSGNSHLNVSKALSLIASYGRLVNLGLNITCASVGLLTGIYGGLFSALGGRDFSVKDYGIQWIRTISNLFKSIRNIGNVATEDKNKALMEMCGITNEVDNMFKDTHLNRVLRIGKREWAYGAFSMCDYVMKSTILNSIISNYRYVNGGFITKELFKLNYKGDKSIWKNSVSVYDILEVKDGVCIPKKEYSDAFNKVRLDIMKKGLDICETADGMLTPELKTLLLANAFGMFLMMHRQYLPRFYGERVSQKKQYDYTYSRTQESLYRTVPRFMYMIYKDYANYRDIGLVLKNIKIDESDKANLRRFSSELGILLSVMPLCTMFIKGKADLDKKDKLLNWISLVAERSMFEAGSPYNLVDIFNTMKTPSAMFGMIDNLNYFISMPLSMIYNKYSNKPIKSGAYKYWYPWQRSIFKSLPGKALYETWKDPLSKRKYFESQIDK